MDHHRSSCLINTRCISCHLWAGFIIKKTARTKEFSFEKSAHLYAISYLRSSNFYRKDQKPISIDRSFILVLGRTHNRQVSLIRHLHFKAWISALRNYQRKLLLSQVLHQAGVRGLQMLPQATVMGQPVKDTTVQDLVRHPKEKHTLLMVPISK